METTSAQSTRRLLVLTALVAGPVLAVASAAIGLGPQPGSMHEAFEAMGRNGSTILVQDLLEMFGFSLLAVGAIGVTRVIRGRGSILALIGAILSVIGIVGFTMSNTAGMAIVALAQLPDQAAAFSAAAAITSSGPLGLMSTLGWILEIAGQVGGFLIIVALWRARIIPWWPAACVLVALIAVSAIGTIEASLIADVVLLAVMVLIVVRVSRLESTEWTA